MHDLKSQAPNPDRGVQFKASRYERCPRAQYCDRGARFEVSSSQFVKGVADLRFSWIDVPICDRGAQFDISTSQSVIGVLDLRSRKATL